MMVVCISRASVLFRSWRRKLQEAGIVHMKLLFNKGCDRQQLLLFLESRSDFQMVCYGRLFLFGGELCFDLVWEWREARVWR